MRTQLFLLVLALLAGLAGAPAASAGSYRYYACEAPSGARAALDASYWTSSNSLHYSGPFDQCTLGGGFGGYLGTEPIAPEHWFSPNQAAHWGFTLPAASGLAYDRLDVSFDHVNAGGKYADQGSAHPWGFFAVDAPGVPTEFVYSCGVWGGCWGGRGPQTYTLNPARKAFTVGAACGGAEGGCSPAPVNQQRLMLRVASAAFNIVDSVDPALTSPVVGSLRAAGARGGRQSLAFTATDAGSGVYQVVVKLGGKEVLRRTPNGNGGRCAEVGSPTDNLREFAHPQPCPASQRVELDVDTALAANGEQELEVRVLDAAGNSQLVLREPVSISNLPPPVGSFAMAKASTGTLKIAYGKKRTLRGVLRQANGQPLGGALVSGGGQLVTGGPWTPLGAVTTAADGSFIFPVPTTASRTIRLSAAGATASAELAVAAKLSLRSSARTLRRRGRLTLSGSVKLEQLPQRGVRVEVQSRWGGRWRTVDAVRTNAKGRWSWRYRVQVATGKLPFRAVLVRAADVPARGGTSRAVTVRVR